MPERHKPRREGLGPDRCGPPFGGGLQVKQQQLDQDEMMIILGNDDIDRFYANCLPEPNCGCWLWNGGINDKGYGYFYYKKIGRGLRAHRVAYFLKHGELPKNLVLDHLCRVRSCVNPDHLEPVSNEENIKRGFIGQTGEASGARINREKTHCPRGHAYSGDNLVTYGVDQDRRCRKCSNDNRRRRRLELKNC